MFLLVVSLLIVSTAADSVSEFEQFKRNYSKSYNAEENHSRINNFLSLREFGYNHNAHYMNRQTTFMIGVNPLTDISYSREYVTKFPKHPAIPQEDKRDVVVEIARNLPEHFELSLPQGGPSDQTANGNLEIMDCNSGWAFATAKAIEIFKLNVNILVKPGTFSAQQLIDCLPSGACQNGTPHKAFKYILEHNTKLLYKEVDYQPFIGRESFCSWDSGIEESETVPYYWTIPDDASEDLLKTILFKYRAPIIFEMNPKNDLFKSYSSGIYKTEDLYEHVPVDGSHYMVLVGYGTHQDVHYWKAVNSFGPNWGENGYIRFKRNDILIQNFIFPSY